MTERNNTFCWLFILFAVISFVYSVFMTVFYAAVGMNIPDDTYLRGMVFGFFVVWAFVKSAESD
jgi:hypothetical protein